MKLENKVAIITGAGSGIGRAMALTFSGAGATVVLGDINEDGVGGTLTAVEEQWGRGAIVVGDVGLVETARELIGRTHKDFGRVDILCNNAGILDSLTPAADCSDELWDQVIRVNLTGPMRISREALPVMIEQGEGVILNTASVASSGGGRGGAAYTASKHGVLGLTRSIAWYYGDRGIRCNAIAPGAIMTPMSMQMPHEGGLQKLSPYLPVIKRYGEPEEVANAAMFLVSDEAKYLNGSVLTVDGGWTLF